MFNPRQKQSEVLEYSGGRMGVSAVPGSGKTQTLAYLAARLIATLPLDEDQEVLIVTLVNSAVDNFASRVADFLETADAPNPSAYRVRTLHGLAHDIIRERPTLVGLQDDFQIIDERVADQIAQSATNAWLLSNPAAMDGLINPELDRHARERVRRERLPALVHNYARAFIKQAKDLEASPQDIERLLADLPEHFPLLWIGAGIYADYQRSLSLRGAVDFDDLVRLAAQALRSDPDYLARLRHRWTVILEDEAQDSSRLQEIILRMLSGGNWVRVGDPNQAIYETFTTASPRFLLDFLREPGVTPRELSNSGRSTASIISLANELIRWTQEEHPLDTAQSALTLPLIQPSPPGDPQPNPTDRPDGVILAPNNFGPGEEMEAVANALARWLPDHPQATAAVLTSRNDQGIEMVDLLRSKGVEVVELLQSTRTTRQVAGVLGNVLKYLAEPGSPARLATTYRVWRRNMTIESAQRDLQARVTRTLRRCRQVEAYVYPRPGQNWLDELNLQVEQPEIHEELLAFRAILSRWQSAVALPIDQLAIALSQDLFDQPLDLAVAYKLATVLAQTRANFPEWSLDALADELAVIANNERKFLGFEEDSQGFNPDDHPGKVAVTTIHKAKGLEWDRVHLMAVNNYEFPSGQPNDSYVAERWFVQGQLNIEAEGLTQLRALLSDETPAPVTGEATLAAREAYIAERLRLLYVGITRARKELVVTWNTGRDGSQLPALPFLALRAHLQSYQAEQAAKG